MKKRIAYHIAFWVAYLLFKTYLQIQSDQDTLNIRMLLFLFAAQSVFLVIKVPLVYTLFYILEKYLNKQWTIRKTVFGISGLFILSTALFLPLKQYVVLELLYNVHLSIADTLNFSSIFGTVFILGFVCCAAVAIKLIRLNIRQRIAQQEIIKTKLETELQFLKAQINPHFFFNTLNNIYALARKKSDETPGAVLKLSKLFRFILYESQKKYVSVADEVSVLENYIELEKIRYNDKLSIRFTREIDNDSQLIAPLLLLPFIENAFKHGASESRFSSHIDIVLKVEKGQLIFSSENSKGDGVVKSEAERIGLRNVRRQLELLYPDHLLEITDTTAQFNVVLQLDLNVH